jgi:hypothetical protein
MSKKQLAKIVLILTGTPALYALFWVMALPLDGSKVPIFNPWIAGMTVGFVLMQWAIGVFIMEGDL